MEIFIVPSALLPKMRKEAIKNGEVILHYKKTDRYYVKNKSSVPPPPATEEQAKLRKRLGDLSHEAAAWLNANNPTAHPPLGTDEYQQLQKMYKKQHKSTSLLRYAMARIKKYGKVI